MKYMFSDYTGDRLAQLQSERESTAGTAAQTSAEEASLRAGRDGEQAVARRLLEQSAEPFALVGGYQSWRGEVDLLLITPQVIAAIEVKTLNAEICIDGDCWVKRYRSASGDAAGEWFEIVDDGGRSPSRQINEAADHLQSWLQRNRIPALVRRWVVLAHERSKLVRSSDVTVDAVVPIGDLDLVALVAGAKVVPLTRIDVDRVLSLVRRDHVKGEQRRAARRAGRASDTVPAVRVSSPAERRQLIAHLAARAAVQGVDSPAMTTLRVAIRQDLVGRREPSEVPALLNAFQHDPPVRDLIVRLVDEASQVFEEPARCLVMLTIPVAVRLRKFLAGEYSCDTVNVGVIRAIESVSRAYYRLQRVAFDHRLYSAEAVREIDPLAMRRYARDLADRGAMACAPAPALTLTARSDGSWQTVHVLGVAVLQAAECKRARSLTSLPLPAQFVHHPIGAFDIDRPRCTVPGVMHETSSLGICALSHGLSVGDQELRRLVTGVQEADPMSIFMVPRQLEP